MRRPRDDGALQDGKFFIDHQVGIDLVFETKPRTDRAGAVGVVEAEGARGDLSQADAQ